MQHGKDWTLGRVLRDTASGLKGDIRHEDGRAMALCWGLSTSNAARINSPEYKATCDAIARRFVACWNACEGTSTPWLEGRAAGLRMDGALSLEDQFDAMDKLRAALVEAEERLTLLIARDEHKLLDVVARDKARRALTASK